jgi:hypothetical protein
MDVYWERWRTQNVGANLLEKIFRVTKTKNCLNPECVILNKKTRHVAGF